MPHVRSSEAALARRARAAQRGFLVRGVVSDFRHVRVRAHASAETKPTRMDDHRYGSKRSLDPPIRDVPGLHNMGGFSCCLLGCGAPQKRATELTHIAPPPENPISVGQATGLSHTGDLPYG
jgi:hypothetical protein